MMKQRIFVILGGAVLFSAMAVAQEPPGPAPEGPGRPGHGERMGAGMELLGFEEMLPGKVVTGAPYSAVGVLQSTQTLGDGNTINRKVEANLFRDSQGRTRREVSLPAGPDGQAHSFVVIHDPVSSSMFVLHTDRRVAEKMTPHAHGNAPDMQSRFEAHVQKEIAEGSLKKDDLGTQTINGIAAQGTRYTKTIAAGEMGNEKPMVITTERWYSNELQILVKSTRSDPRQGQSTYTVTSLQRQEPAANMFSVPSDYTITAGRGFRHEHHKGAPPAAAAAPAN